MCPRHKLCAECLLGPVTTIYKQGNQGLWSLRNVSKVLSVVCGGAGSWILIFVMAKPITLIRYGKGKIITLYGRNAADATSTT